MEKKEVYVVTRGWYSDYSIEAVFSSEKKAQLLVNILDDARIETYEIDSVEIKEGHRCYIVRMKKDGTVVDVYQSRTSIDDIAVSFDLHKNLWSFQFAKDEEHAIKIANERRAQIIANNMWGK